MRKNINRTHIEGRLYEHNLVMRETGPQSKNPGTSYISGSISIATDEEMTNIVPVEFTYVTAKTSKGADSPTYAILVNILNGVLGNVMDCGKEDAAKLRIDSSIGLNEFYSDRSGTEELVSTKRNDGGFMHTTNLLNADENQRATFDTDIILTKTIYQEADPDRNRPDDRLILNGFVFNFRNEILPVSYVVQNQAAIGYFSDFGISEANPLYTHLKGIQISTTIVRRIEEEGAWGEVSYREVPVSRKEFVVNWAAKEPYAFGEDITIDEFKECLATRQMTLATIKQRQEESKLRRQNRQNAISSTPTTSNGTYKF